MLEQLHAQIAHGALADIHHNTVIAVGAQDANAVSERHGHQGRRQFGKIRRLGLCQRNDIIINQALHEKRSPKGGQCGTKDAYHNYEKGEFIIPKQIAEEYKQAICAYEGKTMDDLAKK